VWAGRIDTGAGCQCRHWQVEQHPETLDAASELLARAPVTHILLATGFTFPIFGCAIVGHYTEIAFALVVFWAFALFLLFGYVKQEIHRENEIILPISAAHISI
jgi:hypothetical protein